MKTDKLYDVYVLIDPTTAAVFYVGISSRADRRLEQHELGENFGELRKKPVMAIDHAGKNKKWAEAANSSC